MKKNKKSDVKAKQALKKELESKGIYSSVSIIGSPADIVAIKEDEKFYFEIKMTKEKGKCFGAATQTEWMEAIKNPKNYKFVIAKTNEEETEFEFLYFTPEEFMEFSIIPPFKVYFNIDLENINKKSKRIKSIPLTENRLLELNKAFSNL